MRKKKFNRVIYRFWHNLSAKGRVGYIGKDSYWPRRSSLVYRKNRNDQPKLCNALNKYPIKVWHKEVLSSGFKSDKSLNKAEIFYIKKFNSKNKGYNCTDGGEGSLGITVSLETRRKLSEMNSGKNNPLFGKHLSAKTREKISKAHMGMTYSEETKRKVGAATASRKVSLETRKKISNALKGRKFSRETRLKIGRALKGRKFTPEWLEKIAKSREAYFKRLRKGL